MSEWRECRLEDIAYLVKDVYKPQFGDHLPYIGLENIAEQSLRLLGIGDSDSVKSQKFHFKNNDVLFGKLRPYFRKVIKPNFNGVCSTDIWVIRALPENDQNYIFYFFANQEFVDIANSGDSGTRMPRADWNYVKQISWRLPPLPEQQAIAAVLSSLDDKIDLLHRQNKTLEAMAETIWRKMFVEDADPGWEKGAIKDLIDILSGFTFKSSDFLNEGKYRLITIKNVQDGFLDLSKTDTLDIIPTSTPNYCFLQKGDILLSLTGNVGRCCLVTAENLLLNQRVAVLKARNIRDWAFTYILFRQDFMKNDLEELAKGTAQANLSPIETANYKIKQPPDAVLFQYSKLATPLINKVMNNFNQIQTLSRLRNTLLPKLMSGEVRVKG